MNSIYCQLQSWFSLSFCLCLSFFLYLSLTHSVSSQSHLFGLAFSLGCSCELIFFLFLISNLIFFLLHLLLSFLLRFIHLLSLKNERERKGDFVFACLLACHHYLLMFDFTLRCFRRRRRRCCCSCCCRWWIWHQHQQRAAYAYWQYRYLYWLSLLFFFPSLSLSTHNTHKHGCLSIMSFEMKWKNRIQRLHTNWHGFVFIIRFF